MTCECITTTDALLANKGVKLDLTFNVRGDTFPALRVVPVAPGKRRKNVLLIPSYCPFCGVEYQGGP